MARRFHYPFLLASFPSFFLKFHFFRLSLTFFARFIPLIYVVPSSFSQVFFWLLQCKDRRFWVNQEKISSIPLFMFRAFALSYNNKRSRIESSVHSFTSLLTSSVSKGWFSLALYRTWSFLGNSFGSSGGTSNWMRSLVAVSHHPGLLDWPNSIPACTHERVGDRQCHKRGRSCWHRKISFHVTGLPAPGSLCSVPQSIPDPSIWGRSNSALF